MPIWQKKLGKQCFYRKYRNLEGKDGTCRRQARMIDLHINRCRGAVAKLEGVPDVSGVAVDT